MGPRESPELSQPLTFGASAPPSGYDRLAVAPLEPVVILCGGRGTRLRERTESIPKALVEIGGRPILWHVISIYRHQGFRRFLLLTGYRGELIADWVAGEGWAGGIEVSCLD